MLLHLPPEILLLIIEYLDIDSRKQLRISCRAIYQLFQKFQISTQKLHYHSQGFYPLPLGITSLTTRHNFYFAIFRI